MTDMSHLDSQYFIDNSIYNCPFCNRNHVAYSISRKHHFNWTKDKLCYVYYVVCHACLRTSMHLTFTELSTMNLGNSYRWDESDNLDSFFFFSVPTSFFVLDDRVPEVLRLLLTEAEGSQKSNFLTGASACARKIIYELAKYAKVEGDSYVERVKALKGAYPYVDPSFFDTLLTVQDLTSKKVHENALDNWSSKHLKVILAAIREVLHEIFVVPAVRQDRREAIAKLRDELTAPKSNPGAGEVPVKQNALLAGGLQLPKEPDGPESD